MKETDDADIIRMLESGKITERDIHFSIDEDIVIPPNASPAEIQSLMAGAQYRSERIMKLKMARLRFHLLSKVGNASTMDFERYYRELYEDIKAHHDIWFNDIFTDLSNADKTISILGTLCTILRQRGDLDGCMNVMPTYMAVLKKYQEMVKGCKDEVEIRNCDLLAYKASLIRINCGMQTGDKKMAVQAFRDVVAYEKKEKSAGRFDDEQLADYDAVAQSFVGHKRYDKVSDDVIFKALGALTGYAVTTRREPERQIELRECACCDKKEKMYGDFKKCSRCHEQAYCTKECQVKDWKVHKLLCGKKNTTNIGSSILLLIAKMLLKNHTATVEKRTGPVAESQKNDAMAALVKKLKKLFMGEFKHYNDESIVSDSGSDPDFLAALADFFAEQPGYSEVWSAARVGYKEDLKWKQQMKQHLGVLNITDDYIREQCEEMARGFKRHAGKTYAESDDTEELLDQKRHDAMVEGLMNLVKKFAIAKPQYNSCAGFFEMVEDVDFRVKMGLVIAFCMDKRGPQTDRIVDVISENL